MTEVAVTETLGELLSPQPDDHLSDASRQVVLPVSGWLDRTDNGRSGIGQSVSRGTGTEL